MSTPLKGSARTATAFGGVTAVLALFGATTAVAQVPPIPATTAPPSGADAPEPVEAKPDALPRYDGGVEDVDRALANTENTIPLAAGQSRALGATRYRGVSVRDRERPAYNAAGVRVGGFHLFPLAGIEDGYVSNVFATVNGRSDVFARPFAQVRANSEWNLHQLRLQGDVSNRYYSRFRSEEGTEYRLDATGRVDVTDRDRIGGEILNERVIVDRASIGELPNTRDPLRYTQTTGVLTGTVAAGRLLTTLTGTYANRDYSNNALFDGTPLNLDFRDYTRKQARIDVAYEVQGTQSIFVSAEADRRRFKERTGAFGFDTNGYEILGGVRGEITPVIRGQIGLGVLHQGFRNPTIKSSTGLGVDTRLEWLVTKLTTLTFMARRDIQTSALRTNLGYTATTFQLRIDHELLRNLLLIGQVQYQTAEYRLADRKDHLMRGLIGADWLVNRHIRVLPRAFVSRRTSSADLRPNFNAFGTTLSVAYAL
jgi:hypothetical protein